MNRIPAYLADSGLFSGIFRVNWRTAAAFRIGVVSNGSAGVKGQDPRKSAVLADQVGLVSVYLAEFSALFSGRRADDARTPLEMDRRARNRRDSKIHVDGPVDPEGRSVGLEKRAAAVKITDDDGATTDFCARRCDVSNPRDGPDSPIQAWVSPALTGPRPGSPPIKPEGGREKTTAGFAVRSLNRSDTSCRLPFIIGLESLDLTGGGFAVHCWTRTESVDSFAFH